MATERQQMQTPELNRVRSPLDCRHRVAIGRDSIDGGFGCQLIQRLTESTSLDECRVEPEGCRACCRIAEATEYNPNSVVASLAQSLLITQLQRATDANVAVRSSERLVWLEQYLEDHDTTAGTRADHRPTAQSVIKRLARRRSWRLRWGLAPRIGLVGSNNRKGLGHLNRDMVRQLGIHDWLLPVARGDEFAEAKRLARRAVLVDSTDKHSPVTQRFLDSIDVLLFAETPYISAITADARRRGISVVCVPTWERIHPGLDWLRDVDLMVAPTEFTQQILHDWQRRFGFEWRVTCFPWPIDVASFPFRVRTQCRRFVYINGTDLEHPRDRSGIETRVRRKGLETLLAAARSLPHIPFLIWSQVGDLPDLPGNVELRMSADENADLYRDGDVCVQLSRWEGLGLALLECQVAGLPLITTDAPPMSEHNPLAAVPITGLEVLELWPRRWIAAPQLNVEDVVRVLQDWYGRDISEQSRNARAFVERTHGWREFLPTFRAWIRELIESDRRRP